MLKKIGIVIIIVLAVVFICCKNMNIRDISQGTFVKKCEDRKNGSLY